MKRFISMLLGATIAAGLTAYGYQARSGWPPALKPGVQDVSGPEPRARP